MATAPPQTSLTSEAVRALSGLRTPKFLATRSEEGVANVVPVLSLDAFDDGTLVFGEMMVWKTKRNLESDARVSVLVLAPDLRYWTIRGRFVGFERSGARFDRIAASPDARYNPYGSYRSAGVIEVLETAPVSRISQREVLLGTLRGRLLARRLAADDRPVMPVQVKEKFDRLKAVKALACVDPDGGPHCVPAMPAVAAGRGRLVLGGAAVDAVAALRDGAPLAAAVLSLEPVAYQVKGRFGGLRRSLGQSFAVLDVLEAYSASPPLPGHLLPMKS